MLRAMTTTYWYVLGCDLRNAEISLEDESLEDCVLIIRRHDVHVLYRLGSICALYVRFGVPMERTTGVGKSLLAQQMVDSIYSSIIMECYFIRRLL